MDDNTTDKPAFHQIRDAIYATDLKPGPKFTLTTLCDWLNVARGDWKVWPSQQTIARVTGYSERSIRDHIHVLRDQNLLSIESKNTQNGKHYVYKINHIKLGLPAVFARGGPAKSAQLPAGFADKEQIEEQSKNEVEGTSYRTAPSAGSGEDKFKSEKQIRKGTLDQIRSDYGKSWGKSRPARLSVYCQLGRLYFPENPYFQQKKFKPHHLDVLDYFEDTLGKYYADVLAWTFDEWAKQKDGTTATLMNLEKHSPITLYEGWKSTHKIKAQAATYAVVAANLAQQLAA